MKVIKRYYVLQHTLADINILFKDCVKIINIVDDTNTLLESYRLTLIQIYRQLTSRIQNRCLPWSHRPL